MKKIILTAAAVLGLFALTAPAHSTSITYDLDFEFSGSDEPTGTSPWVTVNFDDSDTAGSVNLTISTIGLADAEIMESLYVNFDEAFDLGELVFAAAAGNDATAYSISTGVNAFKADGDGFFDILFDYPPPPGTPGDPALFSANETVLYTISSSEAITASSFDFFSSPGGGNGAYHVAAHIQRIGPDAGGSGWIGDTDSFAPIPEPATMILFGIGTTLIGFSRRRKK